MQETDPSDLALDADGDLDIVTDLRFNSGLEGVQQSVRIVLYTFREEVFTNLDEGVPWFQEIIGRPYDEARVRALLAAALLTAHGVSSVTRLTLSFDPVTRVLTVNGNTKTVWDEDVATTITQGV